MLFSRRGDFQKKHVSCLIIYIIYIRNSNVLFGETALHPFFRKKKHISCLNIYYILGFQICFRGLLLNTPLRCASGTIRSDLEVCF